MRTTLNLSDDVLLVARQSAARDGVSLGEAVSRLAREGHSARMQQAARTELLGSRYTVLPARDQIVTTEHVRGLMVKECI